MTSTAKLITILLLIICSSVSANQQDESNDKKAKSIDHSDKKQFVVELLKMMHEQHATTKKEDRLAVSSSQAASQLLNAIGADSDVQRLIDWVQNSFNLASVGELATQFVVHKLGSVNCAALLKPDSEDTLVPRFLLFNDKFVDVPFEFPINPSSNECLNHANFDPARKTVVLLHGYLAGYTVVDGLTNIKNRLLDLNKIMSERSMRVFQEASRSNTSYVLTGDLEMKIRRQQYNVIIVDWFNGANPIPRSNYIKAAVNAQVVGQLIARFLSALVVKCRTPASNIQIIAHSLGCHVAGFTGKAMKANGHLLSKITHLDPIGLCFGRLFSEPKYRLSPADAQDVHAVHVSLNLFDNPLDGARSNFLVNGGRDQIGCGGRQSELKNSTTSSVSLLWDSEAKFVPCSHLRAFALFEDDLSSEPNQCQIVGYRCSSYDTFLAGKCGRCDLQNNQCRLMSLAPVFPQFNKLNLKPQLALTNKLNSSPGGDKLIDIVSDLSHSSIAWVVTDKELNKKISNTVAGLKPEMVSAENEIKRSDRSLVTGERDGLALTLGKLRADTRKGLIESWSSLLGGAKYKVSSPIMQTPVEISSPIALNPDLKLQSTHIIEPTINLQDLADLESPAAHIVGGQAIPAGSSNGPLYFVGTSSLSPYCVNYYQFRLLIAESRIKRLLAGNAGAAQQQVSRISSQIAPDSNEVRPSQRQPVLHKDKLHLTIKLSDSNGHFVNGFTLTEDVRTLNRVPIESLREKAVTGSENMLEITMLLNTTKAEPIRVGESIISYYFHKIVLVDLVEVNYMSNISPDVRARYSSTLCPLAINDQHQLVKYVECSKVNRRK